MILADPSTNTVAMLHYSAPPVIGGVEAVIQAHSKAFQEFNHQVSVIAGRGSEDALPAGVKFVEIPEMDSRHPEMQEMNKALERGKIPDGFDSYAGKLAVRLSQSLSGINHVIAHNLFTKHFNLALTAALFQLIEAAQIRHCIAWCHDFTWTSPGSSKKVHPGYPWDLLRRYHSDITYVTISEERKRSLVDLLQCSADAVHVIYNGVDAEALMGLSGESLRLIRRLGLLESDLNIIMPVRITQAKNIELALSLASEIKSNGISLKLIVTGPPDPHDPESMLYYRSLQEQRDRFGLQNEMRFIFESGLDVGEPYEVDFETVSQLLRASDLMFMPSHREGFGMPVLEAGLLGIPVATTNVPAAREIGEQKVFLFNPEENSNQLARRLIQWMETNPQHLFRRQIRNQYRWEAVFRNQVAPLLGK